MLSLVCLDRHIAPRPQKEWTDELTKRGFTFLRRTTRALKRVATNHIFKQNVGVYAAPGAPLGFADDGEPSKRPKLPAVPDEYAPLLSRDEANKRVRLNTSDGTVELGGQRVPWVPRAWGLRRGEALMWPGLVREQAERCA